MTGNSFRPKRAIRATPSWERGHLTQGELQPGAEVFQESPPHLLGVMKNGVMFLAH